VARITKATNREMAAQHWLLAFLARDERFGIPLSPAGSLHRLHKEHQEYLLNVIRKEKLAYFVASSNDFSKLPAHLREAISKIAVSQAQSALVVARELLNLESILSRAGIDHIFYKGLPLAELTRGNPLARGGGDIDLLVPREQIVRAHQLLTDNGGLPGFRIVPDHGFDFDLFLTLYKEIPYHFGLIDVDLHWRTISPTGVSPKDRVLFHRAQKIRILGREVATFSNYDSLVASACHFYFDGCRSLKQLVDFQLLAGRAVDRANGYSLGVEGLVCAVKHHAEGVFGLEPSKCWSCTANAKLKKRIDSQWSARLSIKTGQNRFTFLLKNLLCSLIRQVSLGRPASNFLRFALSSALDYKGTNFQSDRFILMKSLKRKIATFFSRLMRKAL